MDHILSYTMSPHGQPYASCLWQCWSVTNNGLLVLSHNDLDVLNTFSNDTHHHNRCILKILCIFNAFICIILPGCSELFCRNWCRWPYTWDFDSALNNSLIRVITPHGHIPANIPVKIIDVYIAIVEHLLNMPTWFWA